MQKNFIKFKFKATLILCLFVFATCLTAQNTGGYFKYILDPISQDTGIWTGNGRIFEINNHYYVLSGRTNMYLDKHEVDSTPKLDHFISVYDENLNKIKHIQLDSTQPVSEIFYADSHFYVFVYSWRYICFTKCDDDFNFEPPAYMLTDDTLFDCTLPEKEQWSASYPIMTKNHEFILNLNKYNDKKGGSSIFMRFDLQGRLLERVFIPSSGNWGCIVETDSHYIMNYAYSPDILIFSKDSLSKYEWVRDPDYQEYGAERFDGGAISVGNQLIRSNMHRMSSTEGISITFIDENFKLKNRLEFGSDGYNSRGFRNMDYTNSDSIYYASEISDDKEKTIGIACFSSEGQLYFYHKLDLPVLPVNVLNFHEINQCKVLSNGNVLVVGDVTHVDMQSNAIYPRRSGFLLLYNPTKNVGIVETRHAASLPQIFPNPVRSQFTVTHTENANLYLYNIVGQEVLQTFSKEDNTIINVDFLPQGVYVLKVVKEETVSVHKIVVGD